MSNKLQAYDSLSSIGSYTKEQLLSLAKEQAKEIIKAQSPEQSYAFLMKVKTLVEECLKEIKESAITEVARGNDFAFGVKMDVQGKTTYEFKHDPKWVELDKDKKEYEELMKRKLNDTTKFALVKEDTGEFVDVKPAFKKVSEYIKTDF